MKLTCDQKVRFYKTHWNSMGLLPGPKEVGGTCIGCTKKEGGCFFIPEGKKNPLCYAFGLAKCRKAVHEILASNTKEAETSPYKSFLYMLNEFEQKTKKYCERNKVKYSDYAYFRLHWSGDFFNANYVNAVIKAMRDFPDIKFWTYTRSFKYVPHLMKAENLILYLSVDDCNLYEGFKCFVNNRMWKDSRFKIAYMGKTSEKFLSIVKQIVSKETVLPTKGISDKEYSDFLSWLKKQTVSGCPVDAGLMKLEGGCSKCRQCITNGHPLLFFKT